jgi:hypothetical protein
MPALSLFPRNIFKKPENVVFFRNKENKEKIYICYFDTKSLNDLFNNINAIKERKLSDYMNFIISTKKKILIFETVKYSSGFKFTYQYYNEFFFDYIKKYELYNPTKEEIKEYKISYEEFLKENKELLIERRVSKARKEYRKASESLWYTYILYEIIKYGDSLYYIIKEGSKIYQELLKNNKQEYKKMLKYIKEIEFIKTENEKQRIKDYIISSVNNKKRLSVACIDGGRYYISFVFVERKYKNSRFIYVGTLHKNRNYNSEDKIITINKKVDKDHTEEIDKTLNGFLIYR